MNDLGSDTDWLSSDQCSTWFDRLTSCQEEGTEKQEGIDVDKFMEFLEKTFHKYCAKVDNEYRIDYHELKTLFCVFDKDKDEILNREEFEVMCTTWLHKLYHRNVALIVVDVQNDFIDGSLALINGPAEQDGAEVIEVINEIIKTWPLDAIVYTQDWHPPDHIGFYENLHLRKYQLKKSHDESPNGDPKRENGAKNGDHAQIKLAKLNHKAKVFDTVLFEEGKMEQKLWPTHCVKNTWGAELHPKLRVEANAVRIYKGTLSNVDAYSAFWDNKRLNETGLRQELVARNIDDVFVCGLALDFCVTSTAIDSINSGFRTYVIEDACRGIDLESMRAKREEMEKAGVQLVSSRQFGPDNLSIELAKMMTQELINKERSQH